MTLAIPVEQEVARELDPFIPKELGLPSVEGGLLGS